MPITMRCPQCQRLLSGPRRKAGQQIDCPRCRTPVLLESEHGGPTAVFSSEPAIGGEVEAGGAWRGLPMLLWIILLLLAGLGGVYAAHVLLQETTAVAAPRQEPLVPPVPELGDLPRTEPPPVESVPPPAARDARPDPPPRQPERSAKPPAASKPPAPVGTAEVSATPQAPSRQLVVKRRRQTTDEDLRKQLLDVPELLLDPAWIPGADRAVILSTLPTTNRLYLASVERDLLAHMPGLRADADCQLGPEPARELEALSRQLREVLKSCTLPDGRIDAAALQSILQGGRASWRKPEAVPALQQLLMAESKPARLLLVESLSQIEGPEASAALAQRALFDLSPQVREAAIKALQDRPAESYRQTLLSGFRYPWPPVADHAAEALVALGDEASVPALVDLLKEGDPRLAKSAFPDGKPRVLEVVKVNHLANCMLCHKTSDSDQHPVRGAVPVPGRPLETKNGMFSPYEGSSTSTFIRADITRLKQDMSVLQPVANPGQWPPHQRFDYLLRARPVRPDEKPALMKSKPGPDGKPEPIHEQREAVLFALRELTGKDAGTAHGQWVALLRRPEGE